jgi:GNAT superfamily N-acetyltransferase
MTIRPAGSGDVGQLMALLDRCSPETRYRRFHASTVEPMYREMARVAAPEPGHRSWVAVGPDGTARGTATLAWPASGPPEVALLVEDAWFRRGIGRALIGEVGWAAARAGVDAVVAWVQADNLRAVRFLRAVVPGARLTFDGGELAVTLPVARPAGAAADADRTTTTPPRKRGGEQMEAA